MTDWPAISPDQLGASQTEAAVAPVETLGIPPESFDPFKALVPEPSRGLAPKSVTPISVPHRSLTDDRPAPALSKILRRP